ncbi:Predicted acetyltransferase [Pedococcus cremeus]|uniref:Predicted acetyltransferase n=1 Tax=Pedococcus cremeus TaxID=587636 RepID=A0A1H9XH95_9MICO|nr:GNAT family N-acetyltransferase [Pedococcus cremeus]SES45578.1 Predicted acetyltransferase [Pedococcus cremeus]
MPDSTQPQPQPEPPSAVRVRRVGPDDRAVLERLWLLFRHDLSRFTGTLPHPDGTFRSERLEAALTDAGWAAFLAHHGDSPVGFAFVRSLERQPFVLNSFFVVAGARRTGVGSQFVHEVLATFPGRWEVAFQEANTVAGHFWRAVAASHDPRWSEERRAVPGQPDVPPDSWIGFTVHDR